jgi:dihydroorotate dehydrogenase (NAD+) catalytic subunit
MTMNQALPRYDVHQSYRWNYDHAPDPVDCQVDSMPGRWTFAGLPAAGPLGIAAGPLLNGKWILYYASLGFDVLTYKTVRSGYRPCYPMPNLVHVPDLDRTDDRRDVIATDATTATWAVSFGMPSSEPDQWRRDIETTRRRLCSEKLLSVSVVGTVQPGWSIDELAADYALCARWAVQSGADAVEANLSCPNVDTCDGQLYQRPAEAGIVASAISREIGNVPLILKVGHVVDETSAQQLLESIAELATAIAMTNSVSGRVRTTDDQWLFDGQRRGICGAATFNASRNQVRMFSRQIDHLGLAISLIGVGGASTAAHVHDFVDAGSECVHLATAAMLDPGIAIKIKSGWH